MLILKITISIKISSFSSSRTRTVPPDHRPHFVWPSAKWWSVPSYPRTKLWATLNNIISKNCVMSSILQKVSFYQWRAYRQIVFDHCIILGSWLLKLKEMSLSVNMIEMRRIKSAVFTIAAWQSISTFVELRLDRTETWACRCVGARLAGIGSQHTLRVRQSYVKAATRLVDELLIAHLHANVLCVLQGDRPLTGRAIISVRAVLDQVVVHEVERLVLLPVHFGDVVINTLAVGCGHVVDERTSHYDIRWLWRRRLNSLSILTKS